MKLTKHKNLEFAIDVLKQQTRKYECIPELLL